MVNSRINDEADLLLRASKDGFQIGMRGLNISHFELVGPFYSTAFAWAGKRKMSREQALATLEQMKVGIEAMIDVVKNMELTPPYKDGSDE